MHVSTSGVLTTSAVPKMMIGSVGKFGSSSMIIENVSQIFARANHENTREKMLYYSKLQPQLYSRK